MAEPQQSGPIDASERSPMLDSLRGWALLGILVANMVSFIGFPFLDDAQRGATIGAAFDDISELLLEWLVVGKFYSIFSLLFGIGFAIQLNRLEQRGEGVPRYLRRLAVMFLIGMAHMLFMWLGDIVALYALMGGVLLLFRHQSDRALIGWAIALWLVPLAWSALIHFGGINLAEPIYGLGVQTLTAWGVDLSNGPLPHFRDAGFWEALSVRPAQAYFRLGDLVYQMRFTKVLGMFLIGLWIGRRAVYAQLDEYASLLRKVARWGLAIGLPVSLVKAILAMWPGDEIPLVEFAAEAAYVLGTPTLALGYAAGFALLWRGGRHPSLQWAAPAGRMALTNYLMQTILQSLLFYGWGLGLIGKLGLVFIYPISLALFALQVAYSRWWLARFRFGPVEWLWRSLTYGRAQPMRMAIAA
ncbi:MAG TPA: DUF418 domain-containing protein [Sphingomicrobium sp.]|nr:DUF418 domain-containing protein [Sphingomicrobium sp.]